MNIPKNRILVKEKIFLYQITFCNQKAKIDLHHVYKRSMCLSLGGDICGLCGIVCASNRNMMMFSKYLLLIVFLGSVSPCT